MIGRKLIFILVLVVVISCSPEKVKIYKVDYQNNFQVGVFRANLGNATLFTNGPDILEVHAEKKPEFFCYAVNKDVLCRLSLKVKISNGAAEEYRAATQSLKESASSSGKGSSVLPERLVYSVNDEKIEEGVLFLDSLQNKEIDFLPIQLSGKGSDEKEAQTNALKKSNDIINILIDKK